MGGPHVKFRGGPHLPLPRHCAYVWHAFRIARMVYNVALGVLFGQLKYLHDPYLRFVSLFYAIVSSFTLLAIAEVFHCAGALRLDNCKVFRCPGCKVSLVFFFCFMRK